MSERAKTRLTVFPSASRTATATSGEFQSPWYTGIILNINCSARSGTSPTLDVKIQGKDPESGTWYDVPNAAATQITATGHTSFRLGPGLAATAGVSANTFLPYSWRVVATVGGTSPNFTYSVGATLIEC